MERPQLRILQELDCDVTCFDVSDQYIRKHLDNVMVSGQVMSVETNHKMINLGSISVAHKRHVHFGLLYG